MVYYGQIIDGIEVDKILHERYFPNKTNGFFIECGAYDGVLDSSCKFFEETKNWKGINIEPFAPIYERLIVNRPNSVANLNLGLSNKNGEASFVSTMEVFSGCGSIVVDNFVPYSIPDNRKNLYKSKIQITTYKDIINNYNIQNLDLFVLDVEGHEMQVFEGMSGCSVLPQMMCIEFGHVGLEKIKWAASQIGLKCDFVDSVNAFFIK